MPSSKPRLYDALHPSGVSNNEERKYHWGFLVGPKSEKKDQVPGMRYHVKNTPLQGWQYEEVELENVRGMNNLLARVLIAKVEDHEHLAAIVRSQPVVQNDPSWRCRTWIAGVLNELARDGKAVGTSELDWEKIEATARQYVVSKLAAGRYGNSDLVVKPKPTWDMIENREIVR